MTTSAGYQPCGNRHVFPRDRFAGTARAVVICGKPEGHPEPTHEGINGSTAFAWRDLCGPCRVGDHQGCSGCPCGYCEELRRDVEEYDRLHAGADGRPTVPTEPFA